MRISLVAAGSAILLGCVSTKLDTGGNHPANPSAHPQPRAQPAAALKSDFDPFQAYETEGAAHAARPVHARHGDAAAEQVASFTCPMHPEIVRAAPGSCPICGMKLVPAKSAPKEHAH
jgi:hypothetical protein